MSGLRMNSLILVFLHAGVVFSANPKRHKQQSDNIDLTYPYGPSCSPSDAAKHAANWSRCPTDNNAWYGLTNEAMDYHEAAEQCESFGAKLVSPSGSTIDFCAANSINVNMAFDQLVLYSGRYLKDDSTWVWCSGSRCDTSFDYVNWDNASSSEGNCMGGYLQDSDAAEIVGGISSYGWVKRDCKEVLVRAMCRLDCDTTQYLMYTLKESQTIYSYILDVNQKPFKSGQFEIPFSTKFPGLAFNKQLKKLEIIGDWSSSKNTNHQMMSTAGSFSDAPDSLFDGDDHFEVAYSQNIGTLVFSGYGHSGSTQVYIVTQNSNWNKIESSDKYLNPFQNPGSSSNYYGYGVAEEKSKIYLVGGYSNSYQDSIQVVDFIDVETLQDAQTRQWTFMENLENSVSRPAVIYSNDQLLVVGRTTSYSTCQDVQYLNPASNTTGVYSSNIDCGKNSLGYYYPGMFDIVGGNVSIFGGHRAADDCIQQTAFVDDLDSEWACFSSQESGFEGLGYLSDGSSAEIRYSNFVLGN